MSAHSLYENYKKRVNALQKHVTELAKQAEEVRKIEAANSDARFFAGEANKRIAYLLSEKEALKGDFGDASFQGDEERLAEIVAKRDAIDREIHDLKAEVEGYYAGVVQHNLQDITELAVSLDTISRPDTATLVREMHRLLRAEADAIDEKVKAARGHVPVLDRELYDDTRHSIEWSHPSTEQRIAAQQKREERAAQDAREYAALGGL